jgi:hypothetical protein
MFLHLSLSPQFTILTKTSRSGLNNNQKKIKQTLKIAAARGDSFTTAVRQPCFAPI